MVVKKVMGFTDKVNKKVNKRGRNKNRMPQNNDDDCDSG